MRFSVALTALFGFLAISNPVFGQDDGGPDGGPDGDMGNDVSAGNSTIGREGVDFTSFETGQVDKSGRTIIPIIWLLHKVFHHPKPKPVCQYGTQNCCYGRDSDGCCIGGSGNCNPCPGPGCPIPCFNGQGPGCPPPVCPGPYCPYPCPGPQCPYICPGPYCGQFCPGPRCPIRCPGPNCPMVCPGPYCPTPCYGPGCNIYYCPPQICNIDYPYRPIIFNININQNIIFNGDNGYVCIRVPNGNGGSYRVCGPRDNLKCYLTPDNHYQVRIQNPTDPNLTIS